MSAWVTLKWQAVASADGYRIHYGTASGPPYEHVVSVAVGELADASNPEWTVEGLPFDEAAPATWFFRATAYKGGRVIASEEPEPLDTPVVTSATTTDTTASLEWGAVDGADSYRVERLDAADGAVAETGTTTATAYEWTGLSPETDYWFRVVAVAADRESEPSTVQAVTTAAAPVTLTEETYTTDTQSGSAYAYVYNKVTVDEALTVHRVKHRVTGADSAVRCRVQSADGATTHADVTVAAGAAGWLEFELPAPVALAVGTTYRVRFDYATSKKAFTAAGLFNGTYWNGTKAGFGTSEFDYTVAMGLLFTTP